MPRAQQICSRPGCPDVRTPGGTRCERHEAEAEQARGSATERGYGKRHRSRFRPGVLRAHPFCQCTDEQHGHHRGRRCVAPSTVADHYPRSRRELVALGLDPDDPRFGRGLCAPCHNAHTAQAQPGGWHA